MRHSYESSQWVPYPAAEVFAFFSDPENLPRLMPSWHKARIERAFLVAPSLSPVHWTRTTPVAGKGSLLTISFRAIPLVPVRFTWVAFISEFAWNSHFCDEQQTGPLAYWKHCHVVASEMRDGIAGSLVSDKVTYALPFGPLGDFANALFIKRQMKSTFDFRGRRLLQLLAK
jgi:ligand-binding SRPBCC domain-containing protein